ncbi:helix-turn-helix domain-containing protein [Deinococcus humi]|uniref:Transcriptional regulator with XRE-family HTH domain n=1 Tax=Deinococcus humi TaxID=662880 RepID=A0A7W8JUM2_9DEIO|nr:helix-turn-helix transcriptional regulator [Deinococcus humi]MBB5362111.1 transcriptional regulator with XRE-family HTH domain [Deinococcus humi]GGO22016.1 hypothetical protein GCM10008949_08860 [Deinococcus humi]
MQVAFQRYDRTFLMAAIETPGQKLERFLLRAEMQQKELAAQLGVEPSYISRMVNDRIGWVHGRYFGKIATILRLSDAEIAELNPAAVINAPLTDAERRGWTLPPEVEPEIPDMLLEAAQLYGHGKNAPLAERRWLLELSDLDFREEPESPEDWLAIYVRLSKLIDPK